MNYYMLYIEDLAIPGVSNLESVWETKPNEGSCIVYITEKAAQNVTFGLLAAAWLFRLTGWFPIMVLANIWKQGVQIEVS